MRTISGATMRKFLLLTASHAGAVVVGFAAGVYTLPILTAPEATSAAKIDSLARTAEYTGEFHRDLKGSDPLHWGEGTVSINRQTISLAGKIAPGPDYKLYLSPEFVETEEDFSRVKAQSVRLGDVKTFENFIVSVPQSVDVAQFNTVIVWCESFSQFITAAQYRPTQGERANAPATAKSTFLVVYKPGPAWMPGKPLKEQPLKEHGRYMLSLYNEGTLKAAGPFSDNTGGAVTFVAPDETEARAIVANDPAVISGVFVYELHPWGPVDWERFRKK